MNRLVPLAVVTAVSLAALPAVAQFGTLFGEPPPRPPAPIPNAPAAPAPTPPIAQPQPGIAPPPLQQPAPPPPAAAPPVAARQPNAIQSQPLAPPPGATTAEPAARGRPLPVPANPPPPQPANTAPQPEDTVITEAPTQHIANERAVFSGLDKITGRIINFDAAINETVQFGALQVTPRACYTRPPTETPKTDAFLEVDEVTLQGEIKRIFTGWMFAASPGLHAVEHPIYDVWLTDCKGPVATAENPAPTTAPAAAPTPPAPSRPRPARPAAAPAAALPPQPR